MRRFLAWRFPGIAREDLGDLAQDVLLDMHQRLIRRYDPDIGRFRAFLKVAIENRTRDWLRKRRRELAASEVGAELELVCEPPPIDELEAAALDLEAELVRAIRAFHDRYASGSDRDRTIVRCYGYKVLEGLSERAIGRELKLTRDRVKEALRTARAEILKELAGNLLSRDAAPALETEVAQTADLVRRALREPRRRATFLDKAQSDRIRGAVDALESAIGAARRHFVCSATESGREFLRALEEILKEA